MKKFAALFLIFGILVFSNISLVFAQNSTLEGGNEGKTVAAGTVIAAAMESIGYKAQSQILTTLNQDLSDVAGLIYLGVLISAILTAALLGNYMPAIWVLIGPPLFLFLSGFNAAGQKNTIFASGADWQFGAFEDNGGFKEEVMRQSDSQSEVSFVFHKYNELISEIYQELISKITSQDISKQMLFMARQRVLEDLFGMEIRDGRTKELSAYFLSMCDKEMTLARQVAQGRDQPSAKQTATYTDARELYCEMMPRLNKRIDNIALEEFLEQLDPPHEKGNLVSCELMWSWMRQAIVKDIAEQSEDSFKNAFGPEALQYLAGGANLVGRTLGDIYSKITTQKESSTENDDPCAMAGEEHDEGIENTGNVFNALANIFSGLLVRKVQVQESGSTSFRRILAGDVSGVVELDNQLAGGVKVNLAGKSRQLRSIKSQELATARKFEAFNLLMLIPYIQGALLYALSVMYPFFAMLVLVPGKAGGFLNWMALWAWAKSWDVGWAVVMVTDQLLWEIMPHTTFYDAGGNGGYTPINLMEMHYSGDYSFSVALYWMTVSMLVTSVPIITAEAILGAKKAVSGVVLSGVNDIAARLATGAEAYVANENVGKIVDARAQREIVGMEAQTNAAAAGADANMRRIAGAMPQDPPMQEMSKGATGRLGSNGDTTQDEQSESFKERAAQAELSKKERGEE